MADQLKPNEERRVAAALAIELKHATLIDALQRVVANPETLREVADAIATDWHPPLKIGADGEVEVECRILGKQWRKVRRPHG